MPSVVAPSSIASPRNSSAAAAAGRILNLSGSSSSYAADQQPKFAFNDFLRKEYRFGLDPNRKVCAFFVQGHCPLGNECPDKHTASSTFNKLVVPRTHCFLTVSANRCHLSFLVLFVNIGYVHCARRASYASSSTNTICSVTPVPPALFAQLTAGLLMLIAELTQRFH